MVTLLRSRAGLRGESPSCAVNGPWSERGTPRRSVAGAWAAVSSISGARPTRIKTWGVVV